MSRVLTELEFGDSVIITLRATVEKVFVDGDETIVITNLGEFGTEDGSLVSIGPDLED